MNEAYVAFYTAECKRIADELVLAHVERLGHLAGVDYSTLVSYAMLALNRTPMDDWSLLHPFVNKGKIWIGV